MTFRQKILVIFAATFAGLVLSFVLGEIVLRLSAPSAFRLQNNQIILPKNRSYVYRNVGLRGSDPVIVHHKNSLGFRGAEPPADFDDRLTVIAVGGSTTECFLLIRRPFLAGTCGRKIADRFPKTVDQ